MAGYGSGPYGSGPYGTGLGGGATSMITWNDPTVRYFETGLDRGVLYPKGGPAVPWNGLTGVDEKGGDGSTAYYVDGRPFLFLPKPKEFQATLTAYTYPDEFAPMMGLVEAADGVYLDSQQSDSFDLSYRTLIGNAVVGEALGYKIHLIYNATVIPQDASFGTSGDTVNPTEFSWEIQAVPVPVSGYRATAHVTIDTRHMDSARLAEIETMLYGDPETLDGLPAPQTILDTLSFGDTIVILDNGDGTWTAEGSYKNIYMIGDGIFQIDNVNAVDNLDGTYTISSTP